MLISSCKQNRILAKMFLVTIWMLLVGCSGSSETGSKTITSFKFSSPETIGIIDEQSHSIMLTVPFGTDLTALVPKIAHNGISISPASGVAQDFSFPVKYTVTAADGTKQAYNVSASPSCITIIFGLGQTLDISLWGAGGMASNAGNGGGGGYVSGTITVAEGDILTLIRGTAIGGIDDEVNSNTVGSIIINSGLAGASPIYTPGIGGYIGVVRPALIGDLENNIYFTGGYGGGGNGGGSLYKGGGGGGASWVLRGSTVLMVAAGGGGAGNGGDVFTSNGGAGGGLIGEAGGNGGQGVTFGGGGGTQLAGGAGGAGNVSGANGISKFGGNANTAGNVGGGGGGGGFYGGGAGGGDIGSAYSGAGGGGGSSYINPLFVTNGVILGGIGATPGNSNDPSRDIIGNGGKRSPYSLPGNGQILLNSL